MLNLALQRLVSYSFVHISLHIGCLPLQKLTQKLKFLPARADGQWQVMQVCLSFLWSTGQVSGERLTCT